MGFSLFGDSGNSSSNTTNNTDSSQRNALTAQTGNPVLGSGNIVNDAGLVGLGIQNNNLSAGILSHINDTNTALLGKLADVVKTTSNDVLQSAVASKDATKAAIDSTGDVVNNISDNLTKYLAIGAAVLGAFYLLKGH